MDLAFLGILISLIIVDIKPYNRFNKLRYIDVEQSKSLKGICAVVIFIHHISPEVGGDMFKECGFLSVSIFIFLSAFGLTRKWIKYRIRELDDIIYIKIPELLAISVFSILYKVIYLIIIDEKMSIKNIIIGALTGNKVLNWFFPVIIVLYGLFALSIFINDKMGCNEKMLVKINIVLVVIFSIILFYFFIKGYILVHWLISLFAFPFGIFMAIEDFAQFMDKKSNIFISFILFILMFVMCHCVDANGILFIRVFKMFLYYILSILICILAYYFVRYKCSKYIFLNIGKFSAEIILTQNMAITMMRNKKIYIDSNIVYVLMTVFIQIALVTILTPIYSIIKLRMKNFGKQIIERKK